MFSFRNLNIYSRSLFLNRADVILYLLFFMCFFINFQDISSLVKLKQIMLLFLCAYLSSVRIHRFRIDTSLVLSCAILIVVTLNFVFVEEFYLLTDSFILITLLSIPLWDLELVDSKTLSWIEASTIIAIFLNLLFFRSNGRSTIGNIDPNFSSLLIFLFVCYLIKMKRSKWFIGTAILIGFMTLSRTYFVAIVLLSLGLIITNRKLLLLSFLLLPISFLFLLHFFTAGQLQERFPALYNISEKLYYGSAEHTNPLRILHIVGNTSDNIRSTINSKTIELLAVDRNFLFFGSHPEKFEATHGFKSAHNFFLFQITQSGIFLGLLALISVYYLFLKRFEGSNAAILIGFASYISFLGIEVGSVYFLFLIVIIYLNPVFGPRVDIQKE